jgi:Glycosyltransferase family 87
MRPARAAGALRARIGLAAAIVTLVLVWTGLVVTHSVTPPAVPKSVALHFVLNAPATAKMLASVHWTRADVAPLDRRDELLDFYRGSRLVATITVGWAGHVVVLNVTDLKQQGSAYGSNIANDGSVLGMLAAVFVLMTAVWPLWRMRNLDVLAVVSLTLSVVLYNAGRLTTMVLVTYPALIYLAFRCGCWALARRDEPAPAVPLYDRLTARWSQLQRVRLLRLGVAACALIVVMVGLTSPHVIDVGYAAMEGATFILHGILPYGHPMDILHGDTYPIASYLLYVPFAWLSPVHNVWDDADFTLLIAVAAALIMAAGVWRMLARDVPHGPDKSHPGQTSGLRSAVALLTFPPLLVTVSTGTSDVALGAMLAVALLLWRRPGWGMAVLSGAAWFKLAPLALMPLMLARLRGRALGWAAGALLITSVTMGVILVGLGGLSAPGRMLTAIGFQFTRSSPHTLWAILGSMPLQPFAEAATLALVVGSMVRLRRDSGLADDRRRLAALAAAVLLGIQIAANYWNYMYLGWLLPLIVLSLLAEPSPGTN